MLVPPVADRGGGSEHQGQHGEYERLDEPHEQLQPQERYQAYQRDQECHGDQQHLVLHRDGKETQCFRFDEGGDDIWNSEISYYGRGHINQVHHLIDSIVNDTVPRYGGEDGIHAIHCTLAAIRSAEETRPIQLVDIDPSYTAY